MVTDYKKISDYNVNKICSLFEYSHDINYITKMLPEFEYNMIISVLLSTNMYNNILPNYMCQLHINDKMIMLISDTHFGSKYDNILYTYRAIEFAVVQGIKSIYHGGDILHGNPGNSRAKMDCMSQVEFFLEHYPYVKDMITRAIRGNHDYLAIKEKGRIYYDLNSRDDIEILGSKKVFIDWDGMKIGLQHNIEKYKIGFSGIDFHEDFNFKGHSHYFKIRELEYQYHTHIPALCDDPTYLLAKKNEIDDPTVFRPGFLIAEKFNDYILVTNYYFNNNNYIVRGGEHPLVKKYKNTSI